MAAQQAECIAFDGEGGWYQDQLGCAQQEQREEVQEGGGSGMRRDQRAADEDEEHEESDPHRPTRSAERHRELAGWGIHVDHDSGRPDECQAGRRAHTAAP